MSVSQQALRQGSGCGRARVGLPGMFSSSEKGSDRGAVHAADGWALGKTLNRHIHKPCWGWPVTKAVAVPCRTCMACLAVRCQARCCQAEHARMTAGHANMSGLRSLGV